MRKEIYIGWDIGGAHLKSCVINNQKTVCSVDLCELWKTKELGYIIGQIIEQHAHNGIINNVITMSGEMCDIFENRDQGVKEILNYFKKFANTHVYTRHCGIVNVKYNKKLQNIASANWHVIAKFMSKKLANAIIIDLGSTTTDFILIKNSKIINKRVDDFSGLSSQELLYVGCLRTPPYIFERSLRINKKDIHIIPENFSSLADVYRIIKKIPKSLYYSSTCDDKEKDIKACMVRFARNFGLDYKQKQHKFLVSAAQKISDLHSTILNKVIDYHIEKNFLSEKNVKIIGLGIGEEIIRDLCVKNHREYLDLSTIMGARMSRKNISPHHIAPAYFLAMMLKAERMLEQD